MVTTTEKEKIGLVMSHSISVEPGDSKHCVRGQWCWLASTSFVLVIVTVIVTNIIMTTKFFCVVTYSKLS